MTTTKKADNHVRILKNVSTCSEEAQDLFILLCHHADAEGKGTISTQQIHQESRLPISPALRRRALNDLEEIGAVEPRQVISRVTFGTPSIYFQIHPAFAGGLAPISVGFALATAMGKAGAAARAPRRAKGAH
jgi:hypothetical protein